MKYMLEQLKKEKANKATEDDDDNEARKAIDLMINQLVPR